MSAYLFFLSVGVSFSVVFVVPWLLGLWVDSMTRTFFKDWPGDGA